jgi:hypothetical protein
MIVPLYQVGTQACCCFPPPRRTDVTSDDIQAEISPPHARGLLSGWTQQMIGVGFLVASLVGELYNASCAA